MLTAEEIKVVDMSGDLWNAFIMLPELHPHDKPEFVHHLHALQNIIMSRPALRQLLERDKDEPDKAATSRWQEIEKKMNKEAMELLNRKDKKPPHIIWPGRGVGNT